MKPNKSIQEIIAARKDFSEAWDTYRKKHKAFAAFQAIVFIILLVAALAYFVDAVQADVMIINPEQSATIKTDFELVAEINETAKYDSVWARFDYTSPNQMLIGEQTGNTTTWGLPIKLNYLKNIGVEGNTILTVYYKTLDGDRKSKVINLIINHPVSPTGTATFTILDYNNNPVGDVTVQPTGNKSDSAGVLIVRDQPISKITYSFSKPGWNTTTSAITFTENALQQVQTITLRKDGDSLKTFELSGFNELVEQGTLSYIKVKDAQTKEYISGARVTLFDGSQIKSIPGDTISGRISVGYNEIGDFDLVVEKNGYREYRETVTVIESRRVTPLPTLMPTPAPTPVPTPEKKYYPDANMVLTQDEYRAWQSVQEEKTRRENLDRTNATRIITATPPPQDPPYLTYGLLGIVAMALVLTTLKNKKGRDKEKEPEDTIRDNDPRLVKTAVPDDSTMVNCDQCSWSAIIPTKDIATLDAIKKEHTKTHEV
ncbi:MAG: hypothetical protein PHP06_05965 [Clostridia bacterium]|nr:hypothetical protein [Clostridia bacterium]